MTVTHYKEHPEFNNACVFRTRYLLFKGKYKIDEFLHTSGLYIETLDNILQFNAGKSSADDPSETLGLCSATTNEQNNWLQSAPGRLAYGLGYHLVAGINALHGDGLTQQQIITLNKKYRPKIDCIVSELVTIEERFKNIYERKVSTVQVKLLREMVLKTAGIIEGILHDIGSVKVH